jgi:hypothetical protein
MRRWWVQPLGEQPDALSVPLSLLPLVVAAVALLVLVVATLVLLVVLEAGLILGVQVWLMAAVIKLLKVHA